MTKDTSGPAFPIPVACDADGRLLHSEINGLSLRQWYAGQALIGDLASYANREKVPSPQNAAKRAFAIADAMIAEGSK